MKNFILRSVNTESNQSVFKTLVESYNYSMYIEKIKVQKAHSVSFANIKNTLEIIKVKMSDKHFMFSNLNTSIRYTYIN